MSDSTLSLSLNPRVCVMVLHCGCKACSGEVECLVLLWQLLRCKCDQLPLRRSHTSKCGRNLPRGRNEPVSRTTIVIITPEHIRSHTTKLAGCRSHPPLSPGFRPLLLGHRVAAPFNRPPPPVVPFLGPQCSYISAGLNGLCVVVLPSLCPRVQRSHAPQTPRHLVI